MSTRDFVASSMRGGADRPRLEATSPRYGERVIKALLALCGGLSVAITTAIVISLVFPTVDFFREASVVDFLTGTKWAPGFAESVRSFGVLPIVVATLNIVFWALLVAVPVGLLSAIFLSEYAPTWLRRTVKPVLEVLEGIPTVAIGLFGFLFLVPLAADVFPFLDWGLHSVGVAGAAVGLLIVPLVASVSDDAMRSVPGGLREGAYALGASRPRVALRVVFPAAVSGIVAAIVLGVSRAIGETMVVLMVAGGTPQMTINPAESALPMTAHIGVAATGDLAVGTTDYNTAFAVASLLFLMTLAMNMLAIRLVRRFREVYE